MGDRLRAAGERLFVRSRPAWTLAVARIGYGLILLAWTLTLMLDADAFLTEDGVLPNELVSGSGWRWFELGTTGSVWLALVALLVAAIAVLVGFRPTIALLVSFVLLVALQRRNLLILNSGDLLLRDLALLLAFCPTGAALSVDRWRRHGRTALRTAPLIAPWGLRLLQFQVMVIYFFAFWSKNGTTWRNGTAVSTALRLDDLARFDAPDWLVNNVVIIAVLTWGALAVEVGLAFLLWCKPLRPVLIGLGVALHVFIDAFLLVGFFGLLMLVGLSTFLDAEAIDRRIRNTSRTDAVDDNDAHGAALPSAT